MFKAPAAAALVCLAFTACASSEDEGTAPTVESLTFEVDEAVVGGVSRIRGQIAFSDPDGDVVDAEFRVVSPAGVEGMTSTPIQGVRGSLEGDVAIELAVQTPTAGTYDVLALLYDAEDNGSEPMSGSFALE